MLRPAVLFLVLFVAYSEEENIDIFQPVMRSSPESGITEDDLFGYTLVLHQMNVSGGIDNTR